MELDTNKIDHVVLALLVEETRDKAHEAGEDQERSPSSHRLNKGASFWSLPCLACWNICDRGSCKRFDSLRLKWRPSQLAVMDQRPPTPMAMLETFDHPR